MKLKFTEISRAFAAGPLFVPAASGVRAQRHGLIQGAIKDDRVKASRRFTTSNRLYKPTILLIATASAAMAWAATLPTQTGTSSIKGTVTGAAGVPISGARIVYGRAVPVKSGAPQMMAPPSSTTTTAADGSFAIQNLPAATYILCVQAVNGAYLDPCHWSTAAPTFKLAAGQAVSNAVIQLAQAYQLQIRVSDPQQQLQNEGKTPGSYVNIGAWAPSGAIHMASIVESDTTGRTYSVPIPFNTPVNISVLGGGFQIADASGVSLPSVGAGTSFTAPSTGTVPTLTYTIKGAP
jgi:hypothetical protein